MSRQPQLSVVIPVCDEEGNIAPLLDELSAVLGALGVPWEIICVDDGSTDGSFERLRDAQKSLPQLRVLRFARNCGQTAAFDAGFRHARGEVIITMDADLQNDPHDIPELLRHVPEYDLVCGWRHKRSDSFVRRASSVIANGVRNALSGEHIIDVACSLKAFKREYAQRLKLYTGMHRFFPTLVKMEGGRVLEVKVNHRPRLHGQAKYNIGNRMLRSFIDLLAVCWMKKRRLNYEIKEQT